MTIARCSFARRLTLNARLSVNVTAKEIFPDRFSPDAFENLIAVSWKSFCVRGQALKGSYT